MEEAIIILKALPRHQPLVGGGLSEAQLPWRGGGPTSHGP